MPLIFENFIDNYLDYLFDNLADRPVTFVSFHCVSRISNDCYKSDNNILQEDNKISILGIHSVTVINKWCQQQNINTFVTGLFSTWLVQESQETQY